ncbi:streptogramin A acetyltransferase [Lachnospiraceae bacterium]|nr:streptogramin A acetyltransferase [Lachnospiraceae bacterium]
MFIDKEIKQMIENKLDEGFNKFIIYPFGEIGYRVKQILNFCYGLHEIAICDNHLCKYNKNLLSIEQIKNKQLNVDSIVFLSSINCKIYGSLKENLIKVFSESQIAELKCMHNEYIFQTKCGKYTFGSLKDHPLVEEVGSFCSFADGVDVVPNHAMKYITTHPMLYKGNKNEDLDKIKYDEYRDCDWFFPGVQPYGYRSKFRRIRIGNDVWLGKNVIITNGSYIGNGVIAGAGSIITKDVPDYAIVVGSPARIIRYRYNTQCIDALNKIAWWDWEDDKIRERFNDFYLPVEQFIKKYEMV